MAKKKTDSKINMLEHSKAKVELFQRYLSVYLNILNRVVFITKIYLFDLFAGEGIYENDGKGSPIVAMESIKNSYFANNKKCKDTEVIFNDNGESKIEPGVLKIDRIKRFVSRIFKPQNVTINFKNEEYSVIVKEAIKKLNSLKDSERALVFIDPWGYKEIYVKDIHDILQNKKSELILFLPVSFMYRFAHKAFTEKEFPGGKPLKKFLDSLFNNNIPKYDSVFQFIDAMKRQFRASVPVKYVDTFTIPT
jgi:three-Cys-motif partner protein